MPFLPGLRESQSLSLRAHDGPDPHKKIMSPLENDPNTKPCPVTFQLIMNDPGQTSPFFGVTVRPALPVPSFF